MTRVKTRVRPPSRMGEALARAVNARNLQLETDTLESAKGASLIRRLMARSWRILLLKANGRNRHSRAFRGSAKEDQKGIPKLPHRVRPRVPAVDWVFARVQQRVRARSRREAMARAIMRSNLLTVYCLARIQKRTGLARGLSARDAHQEI